MFKYYVLAAFLIHVSYMTSMEHNYLEKVDKKVIENIKTLMGKRFLECKNYHPLDVEHAKFKKENVTYNGLLWSYLCNHLLKEKFQNSLSITDLITLLDTPDGYFRRSPRQILSLKDIDKIILANNFPVDHDLSSGDYEVQHNELFFGEDLPVLS